MGGKIHLDSIDQKILSYLIKNARMPFLEIARECGISGAAIHQRVKKMEDSGIIDGSRLIVKPKALGYDVCAFVGVSLVQTSYYTEAVEVIKRIPEVVECHFVTGNYAVMLKVFCRDNDHLLDVLVNTVQKIPGVARTETLISLDQAFERQVYVKDKKTTKPATTKKSTKEEKE